MRDVRYINHDRFLVNMSGKEERPWGWFRVLGEGKGFIVKELFIKEGEETSLQYHNHREEFWIVVEGTGTAIVGDSKRELRDGCVIFVPKGVKHRILGGKGGIRIVEVWRGDILDESDIVRLEDRYGRS